MESVERSEVIALRVRSEVMPSMRVRAWDQDATASSARAWAARLSPKDEQFDAVHSVVGAIGLVAPELLLLAIAQHLKPGRTLAFSVPHPQRGGLRLATDDRPRRDYVTLPDRTDCPSPAETPA
jgi:SAM-dependent methyltransferase